jgi:Tfp pilus assembly protein PilZ
VEEKSQRNDGPDASLWGAVQLGVVYETSEALQSAFTRDLSSCALFVPTREPLSPGDLVRVCLDLRFRAERLELDGEVVASLPVHLARAGAEPGVSIQLALSPSELRERLEAVGAVELHELDVRPAEFSRSEPRYPVRTPVQIEANGRRFTAETGDVSYNGMLVLLPGIDLGVGTHVNATIEHPRSGEKLELGGRIANQTRCDHGLMVLGIQFRYELERIDEVSHFVDNLRSFHHARTLATITGSLVDTPLEAVLETFSSASNAGTLRITRGDSLGKIAYHDGEILYATTGLVSGAKALGRLFTWTDALFEFKPEVEPMDDASGRLPLASAILAAAVQRDELARLELGDLDPDVTFTMHADRLTALEPILDALSHEVAEHAAMGFPLGALLDMLSASDALIYKRLAELIDAGVLAAQQG